MTVGIQPEDALRSALASLPPIVIGVLALILGTRVIRSRLQRFPGRWYEISAPPIADDTLLLFEALHELLRGPLIRLSRGQPPFALALHGKEGSIAFRAWLSDDEEARPRAIFRALYPSAQLNPAWAPPSDGLVVALGRARLNPHPPSHLDSASIGLAEFLDVLSQLNAGEELSMEVLLRPTTMNWQERVRRLVDRAVAVARRGMVARSERARSTLTSAPPASDLAPLMFDVEIRLVAATPSFASAQRLLASAALVVSRQSGTSLTLHFGHASRHRRNDDTRRFPLFAGSRLTSNELASFWRAGSAPSLEAAALLGAARRYGMRSSELEDDDLNPGGAWRPLPPRLVEAPEEPVGIGRRIS